MPGNLNVNINEIQISEINQLISWKGKTLTQITSSRRLNKPIVGGTVTVTRMKAKKDTNGLVKEAGGSITYRPSIFKANPLKIYRKEIANSFNSNPCYRNSLSIDEFNRPGGSIINSSTLNNNGLVNTIDNTLSNNTCENPGSCLDFLSIASNARRRCRSSGNIKKVFQGTTISPTPTYFSDAKQYLVNRCKSFSQNQYHYIREGNTAIKPGPGVAALNVYSPNGQNSCPKFYISQACSFQYQWINGQNYPVSVPVGYYFANDINFLLLGAMNERYHFLVDRLGTYVYLLSIVYNTTTRKMEFRSSSYDSTYFPANNYTADIHAKSTWNNYNNNMTTTINPPPKGPGSSLVPGFNFTSSNAVLCDALGISSGVRFPAISITTPTNTQSYSTPQVSYSTRTPTIIEDYKRVYYKPNNSQYAQEGAVTSSSRITRLKYNTINTAASKTNGSIFGKAATKAYGGSIANALSYGVSENPYTMKDRIGYPNITYPSFLPGSKIQRTCTETHTGGGFKNPL
jgi:hypothetical protein